MTCFPRGVALLHDDVRVQRGDQFAETIANVVGDSSVLDPFAWHERQATIRAFAEPPVTR